MSWRVPKSGISLTRLSVVAALVLAGFGVAPLSAQISAETVAADISRFEKRASEWAEAYDRHHDEALERALALGALGRAEEEAQIRAEQEAARLEEERLAREAAEARRQAELAASATTTTTVAPSNSDDDETPAPAPSSGGPTPAQWEALRQCESSGNYGAINPTGSFRGAYQFSISSWDWVASAIVKDQSLVGVDPAEAAPADQDRMAFAYYDWSEEHFGNGARPWPVCGQHLS